MWSVRNSLECAVVYSADSHIEFREEPMGVSKRKDSSHTTHSVPFLRIRRYNIEQGIVQIVLFNTSILWFVLFYLKLFEINFVSEVLPDFTIKIYLQLQQKLFIIISSVYCGDNGFFFVFFYNACWLWKACLLNPFVSFKLGKRTNL